VAPGIVTPFNFQTYEGEPPPFVSAELNVTEVLAQMFVAEALIEIVGATEELTVMVSALDVTVPVEAQAALLVILQVMTSLFANTAVTNVGELVPTFTPFFCH
jgi:hypothetical protein